MNIETNKIIEAIGKSVVETILKKSIIPHIQSELTQYFKGNELRTLIESVDSYCSRKIEKYSIIDTIVFHNYQTLFDIIYQPLTLILNDKYNSGIQEYELVDKYPIGIIEKYQRIIIVDTAGMGKSTITKKIFLSAIKEQIKIPIYIEVRNLNEDNTIQNEIYKQLDFGKSLEISDELLKWFLMQSNCIYIFDGLDEIAANNRETVVKQLHEFVDQHSNTEIIMTSRPEDIMLSFGSFQQFHIKPLDVKESAELIRRYDSYSYVHIANELLLAVESKGNDDILEFMKVPFLLSLIYKCFEYTKDIPLKKSLFYKQVYIALFESHDKSKTGHFTREKQSLLSLDDFDRVLRHVAYFSAQQNEVEYSNDRIIGYIDEAKLYLGDLQFQSSKFLLDILNSVPLFRQDGLNVKWAHKSIQDYFAAKFIWLDAKDKQVDILKTIYESDKLPTIINILDLYEELDTKGFSLTILYWFIKDFLKHNEFVSEFFVSSNETQNRFKAMLFFSIPFFYLSKKIDKNIDNAIAIKKAINEVNEMGNFSELTQIPFSIGDEGVFIIFLCSNKRNIAISNLLSKKRSTLFSIFTNTELEINIITDKFPNEKAITWKNINDLNLTKMDYETLINMLAESRLPNLNECRKKMRELEIWRDKAFKNRLLNW